MEGSPSDRGLGSAGIPIPFPRLQDVSGGVSRIEATLPGIFFGFTWPGDFQWLDGGNISPLISLGCPAGMLRGDDLQGCDAGPRCGDRRIGPCCGDRLAIGPCRGDLCIMPIGRGGGCICPPRDGASPAIREGGGKGRADGESQAFSSGGGGARWLGGGSISPPMQRPTR